MTRISLLLVAFACFTFSGCGGGGEPVVVPDEAEAKTTTAVEDDMAAAGMEGMTDAEYASGGKQE
ncbi:MAG: hypothetical protein ABGZ35_13730 [Planctomycetaceae bacterium]